PVDGCGRYATLTPTSRQLGVDDGAPCAPQPRVVLVVLIAVSPVQRHDPGYVGERSRPGTSDPELPVLGSADIGSKGTDALQEAPPDGACRRCEPVADREQLSEAHRRRSRLVHNLDVESLVRGGAIREHEVDVTVLLEVTHVGLDLLPRPDVVRVQEREVLARGFVQSCVPRRSRAAVRRAHDTNSAVCTG